ncbi:MAG: hypothetical protein U9R51_03620 [Actinomycetota bacterium]|nr:hypothetical protein [Actinomycetota bacterium]
MNSPPSLMVEARRALLDALDALADHRNCLVLVGAQAVYLRTANVDLSFSASYTTDADLAIDPAALGDEPLLAEAMRSAGFELTQPDRPGIWGKWVVVDGRDELVPVDLIVPEALAGPGRRGARLAGHGKRVAGRAVGLEAALIDRAPMKIDSYDPADDRSAIVSVAGQVALLVSKLHKVGERAVEAGTRPDRLLVKDGADIYRLMLSLDPSTALERLGMLLADPVAGGPTRTAVLYLDRLFAAPAGVGVQLAVDGLATDVPADRVEAVCVGFARFVLRGLS